MNTEQKMAAYLRAAREDLVRTIAATFRGAPAADVLDYLYGIERAAANREWPENVRLLSEIQAAAARLPLAERGDGEAS